jgi:hypothetical protein
MSRGLPSMTALLGLLAIVGYQNRDKIAEILGGLGKARPELPAEVAHRFTALEAAVVVALVRRPPTGAAYRPVPFRAAL